ncbi:MAG: SH3 domain-containing protein [Spirochaetes bacterium]|nr:SH3 domain-containing protein [Spirochaetota bacterium]
MKYFALTSILAAVLALSCSAPQQQQQAADTDGVILKDTYIYPSPGGGDSEKKVRVNRGEGVTIKQGSSSGRGWARVMLSDMETEGWIADRYLHRGPKIGITLSQNTSLHVRPDVSSRVLYTLQTGTQLLVLKQLEGWRKVSVEFDKEGWIDTESFVPGFK